MDSRNLHCLVMRFLFLFSFTCLVLAQDSALHVSSISGTGRGGQIVYENNVTVTFLPVDDKPTTIIIVKGNPDSFTAVYNVTDNALHGTHSWIMPALETEAATFYLRLVRGSVVVHSDSFRVFDRAGPPNGPPGRPPQTSTTSSVSTSTNTATATSTPIPTNAPTTVNSPSPSPSPEVESNGGMSTGTKAGIGVGASLGGIALLFGAFYIGRSVQRKRMTQKNDEEETDIDPDRKDRFELGGEGALQELKEGDMYPSELAEKQRVDPVELPGHEYTSELPGDHVRDEDASKQPRTNPYEPK